MDKLREAHLLTHRQRKDFVQIFWLGALLGVMANWIFIPNFYGIGQLSLEPSLCDMSHMRT
jgi:hypothetical protein